MKPQTYTSRRFKVRYKNGDNIVTEVFAAPDAEHLMAHLDYKYIEPISINEIDGRGNHLNPDFLDDRPPIAVAIVIIGAFIMIAGMLAAFYYALSR